MSGSTYLEAAQADHPVQSPDQHRGRQVCPRCDIWESEQAITLLVDLPGVDHGSVDITVDNRVLTLRAASKPDAPAGFAPVFDEAGVVYERSFGLADAIDREHLEAVLTDGVLTLTLPKSVAARPRTIAVGGG